MLLAKEYVGKTEMYFYNALRPDVGELQQTSDATESSDNDEFVE